MFLVKGLLGLIKQEMLLQYYKKETIYLKKTFSQRFVANRREIMSKHATFIE